MPKTKISRHKSLKSVQLSDQKGTLSKIKNAKFLKSIQKSQQNADSQYLIKPPHLKEVKTNQQYKSGNFITKLQKPYENRKKTDENHFDYGKKLYSDEESTNANALFESGQIYQIFISKTKQKPIENKKFSQTEQNDKKRALSESKKIGQSLKNKLNELKELKKLQEIEMKEFQQKSTAEEVHRLEKIQSIQRQMIEKELKEIQGKIKPKFDTKGLNSHLSVKKL